MQYSIFILSVYRNNIYILLYYKYNFGLYYTSTEKSKLNRNTSQEYSFRYRKYTIFCYFYFTSYNDIRKISIRYRNSLYTARGKPRYIYNRRFIDFIQNNRFDCIWTAEILFYFFFSIIAEFFPIAIKLVINNTILFQRFRYIEY